MKLIIAGSRTFDATKLELTFDICDLLNFFDLEWPKELIHGGCPTGADKYCATIADNYWQEVEEKVFYANWDKHGKAAGPIRNKEMAEYADVLLLIWDGKSKGSANMKKEMEKLGKKVCEIILKG